MNKILIICDKKSGDFAAKFCENLLIFIGKKYDFSVEIEVLQTDITPPQAMIDKAKTAHAVLLLGMPSINTKQMYDELAKSLNLHSRISHIKNKEVDFYVACDAMGGIYDGEKGFRTNPKFGREAFDTECYSELEIERVARTAYELAQFDSENIRALNLIDKADTLATSKLWRKIITDINEDYPCVHVCTMLTSDAISLFTSVAYSNDKALSHDVVLAPRLLAEIFENLALNILKISPNEIPTAYLGDTALGMYGTKDNAPISLAGLILSIALMLRHSFNLDKPACDLERCVQNLANADIPNNIDDLLNTIKNELSKY